MKIIPLFVALIAGSFAQDWQLSETGLCIEKPISCPTRIQRYGVCCRLNNSAREFSNYCQACSAVVYILFRVVLNGNTSYQQAKYANEIQFDVCFVYLFVLYFS